MSGDLEDFLRRAAERRRAKADQQQQPQRRPRPEYTDSRRERVTEPIEIAEIVEEPLIAEIAGEPKRLQMPKSRQEGQPASQHPQPRRGQAKPKKDSEQRSSSEAGEYSEGPLHEILEMLKRPGGVQQAILLREILDRPEHRW